MTGSKNGAGGDAVLIGNGGNGGSGGSGGTAGSHGTGGPLLGANGIDGLS